MFWYTIGHIKIVFVYLILVTNAFPVLTSLLALLGYVYVYEQQASWYYKICCSEGPMVQLNIIITLMNGITEYRSTIGKWRYN